MHQGIALHKGVSVEAEYNLRTESWPTHRAGVMAWLESVGVVAGAPADGAKVPGIDVSKLPSSSHGGPRKPGKRRAADGGTDGPSKRRAKVGHDEGGVSYEVIVSPHLTQLPVY